MQTEHLLVLTICWTIKQVSKKKKHLKGIIIYHAFSDNNVIKMEAQVDIDITGKSPNLYKLDGIFVFNPWVKTNPKRKLKNILN